MGTKSCISLLFLSFEELSYSIILPSSFQLSTCPKSLYAQVYCHATSARAKKFLKELILGMPFKIHSLQVDGGSEFMGEFERACQELDILLLVLPPQKPIYNGGVERGNRTFREEFYALPWLSADSIGAMRYELKGAVEKYNHYRPHRALKGLTPYRVHSKDSRGCLRLSRIL